VWPLVEPLDRLAKGAVPFVSADSALLFADVRDHLLKVIDEVDTLNALMDAALHANVALIQVKQNEDMRKISSWIAIGAVPTMIAGIYGMNFEHMPELETQYGYYVVVGLLATVSYGLFRLFRKNEWL
jgi:magnesium transporter